MTKPKLHSEAIVAAFNLAGEYGVVNYSDTHSVWKMGFTFKDPAGVKYGFYARAKGVCLYTDRKLTGEVFNDWAETTGRNVPRGKYRYYVTTENLEAMMKGIFAK